MTRTLLAVLAALILVVPAEAAPSDYLQPFRTTAVNQRVAVIWPTRWDALLQSNVYGQKRQLDRVLGNTTDMLREQGIEVHHYYTEYFWRSTDQHNLWLTLGSYYGAALCVGHSSESGSQVTSELFFNPDSTTTRLIHVGGGSVQWADSTDTGMRATSTSAVASFGYLTGAVAPYTSPTDSLFIQNGGCPLRAVALPAAISSVVRLFKPLQLVDGTIRTFISSADTTVAAQTIGADSTAAASELLPLAWRTYRSSGASVDFLFTPTANTFQQSLGHVVYALLARRLAVRPIAIALEFDDVFDNNPTTDTRTTNAVWDSLLGYLKTRWSITPSIAVNTYHAAQYIAGTNPDYEAAWTGDAYAWPHKYRMPWVHHAHDSTGAGYKGNLVGRFGGYSTGNGSNAGVASGSNSVQYLYTHRFASRFNPGNATTAYQYGIVQRLQVSDSLRRSACQECFTPPYLNFCNNELLPVDWRSRPTAQRTSWIGSGALPLDSLWWAFAEGTGQPNGSTFYVRGLYMRGTQTSANYPSRPWGDASVWTIHSSADRDSVLAFTPFVYPDERTGSYINGRLTHVRNIAATTYDRGSSASYRQASNWVMAQLFGVFNPVQTGTNTGAVWASETYAVDPNGLGGTNSFSQRNFSASQRTRMVYLHPLNFTAVLGTNGCYALAVLESGMLRGMAGLDNVAGKRLVKWVYPWEVYAK